MMMKRTYTFVFVFAVLVLSAQKKPTYKDYFEEGMFLLAEDNMAGALKNFEAAYRIDSTSANINYLLGVSYLSSARKKTIAEYYLKKAVSDISKNYQADNASEKSAPPLAHLYYGNALHINYKFNDALAQYSSFNQYLSPKDKESHRLLKKGTDAANVAKTLVANPINIKITNMGDSINSEYPEYSAVLSADERMMIFTTDRPNTTGGRKSDDGRYFDDIVVSYKDDEGRWSKPVSLSSNINTPGHEGSINLSPDGQTLIIFKNIPHSKHPQGNGNIYYSTFDGKDWSGLQEFGSDVNTEYWESHACLSTDGNVLFFASERPGGFGGKDIYRCVKLPNGQWSKAWNMGDVINTEDDEDGAFIHPDGQTFFFSSNGPKTMGGYDVMFATLNEDNKFSDVQNMGYPINTTQDDVFYVTSPDGTRAYFSSAQQEGGFGDNDIYQITMPQFREVFLALFKGQIIPAQGETLPDDISIIVTDKQSGDMIGTYRPKVANGAFTTILPPGKEYHFSYLAGDGTEFHQEDVFVNNDMAYQEIRREIGLEPVRLTGKVKTKTVSAGGNVPPQGNNTNTAANNTDTSAHEPPPVKEQKNKKNKKGKKVVYEDSEDNSAVLPRNEYVFYYRYGHSVIDEKTISWNNFINFITENSKQREVIVHVESSASKVPANTSNMELAAERGKNFEIKVAAVLEERGAEMNNVKFEINSMVGGPEYRGDAKAAVKKYEKFQYVKAKAE